MKKSKIALIVLSTLVLASCNLKTEEKQVPAKPAITETVIASPKNIEVCAKDAQGNPIMTASGICWNPGEIVILAPPKEVVVEQPKYKSVEPSKEVEAIIADLEKQKTVPKPKPKPKPKPVVKKKPEYVEQIKETVAYPEVPKTPEEINVLDKLSKLNIIFIPPNKMEVGKMSRVEVIINLAQLEDREKIDGKTTIGAKIYAPGFSIISVSQPKQSFANYKVMGWVWELTPEKAGTKEVVVSLHAKVPDVDAEKFIGTYNKAIKVEEAPTSFFNFWTLGATAGLLVLSIFWYRKRKNSKDIQNRLNSI